MAFSVAAWNVKEGLAQPNYASVVERIKQLDSDVVVLPDAYSLEQDAHGSDDVYLGEAGSRLEEAGYSWFQTEYGEDDGWHHDRHVVMLTRLPFVAYTPMQLAHRNAYHLGVRTDGGDVTVLGVHGDDRTELARVAQARRLIQLYSATDPDEPVVVAGDFNSAHAADRWPRAYRSLPAKALARLVPDAERRSRAIRATRMNGRSLALLTAHGFEDADWKHRPTFTSFGDTQHLQLDHILYSRAVGRMAFELGAASRDSDHLPIKAQLRV